MPRWIRDAIVALSLANICLLSPWLVLLNPKHYTYYNWPADPGLVELKALLICVLLLGLVFWLAASIARRIGSRTVTQLARWVLLLILILPLNSFVADYLRVSISQLLFVHRWYLIVAAVLTVAALGIVYRYNRQLTHAAITLLIILSPLLVVNTGSAIWLRQKYSSPPQAFRDARPSSTVTAREGTPRIIWIIFDELDQRTAFSNPPAELTLPEFHRLRSQSLSASNAFPPNEYTLFSLPALTTGRLVIDSTPAAANDCELTLESGQRVMWSAESNVFSQARAEGFSTGLSGWYHPYCRVIGSSLDWCSWVPVVDHINPALDQLSLSLAIWTTVRTAAFRIPLAFRLVESRYELQRQLDHQEEFQRVSRAANSLLKEDLNLKLLHFPIPHHPWIYGGKSYTDNLHLADRTLGEVRSALENAEQWDKSIILVTSDHWWRESEKTDGKRDQRVPFMLTLPGQNASLEYQKPFNTILTRELLLELLRGNLASPVEVAAWIERKS